MFNLMSNCCSWINKIQEPIRKVTVLVVGLDKAGKTSSIRGMLRVPHSVEAGPTQGCIRTEMRVENYLVSLLDVGGSAESRGSWREFYGEAHGIVFVVDSSDKKRIKDVREVLADLLKQQRVSGKPILVLANKQDKMNALLGSELIELLSLEKLVNQSRSLCHIEPCSALMDLRRWSDRRTLRGLRWLLRVVCLDYPELCTRVAEDRKKPLGPQGPEKNWKSEKTHRRTKGEGLRSSRSDIHQVHQPRPKETKGEGKLQPIKNMLQKETTLKKKLRTKKKRKTLEAKEGEKDNQEANDQEEEDQGDGNEGEQDASRLREKPRSALILPKKGKRITQVKEESLDQPEPANDDEKTLRVKAGKKTRKKIVKVKRKNKINTEEMSESYSRPVDLSDTFELYRKAILALKDRQDQGK